MTASHYLHLYELIEELAKSVDVFVFFEKGNSVVELKHINSSFVQKPHNLFYRMIERYKHFKKLQANGYTTFYCHYTFASAILAKLITSIHGGRVLLWMCVKELQYQQPFNITNIARKLTQDWPTNFALRIVDKLVTCTATMKAYYARIYGVSRVINISYLSEIG